jgi:hypothetical protein
MPALITHADPKKPCPYHYGDIAGQRKRTGKIHFFAGLFTFHI